MHDLNLLFDDKYSIVPCSIEKGYTNKDGMQLSVRVGDVEICKVWYKFNHKPDDADRSNSKTGGKAAYCMVMEKELERLITEKHVDFEVMGYLWAIINKTSWHNGVLKFKRRRKPMQFNDFMGLFGTGKTKTYDILNKLTEYGILVHSEEGYRMERKFIKKGKEKKDGEANDRQGKTKIS